MNRPWGMRRESPGKRKASKRRGRIAGNMTTLPQRPFRINPLAQRGEKRRIGLKRSFDIGRLASGQRQRPAAQAASTDARRLAEIESVDAAVNPSTLRY